MADKGDIKDGGGGRFESGFKAREVAVKVQDNVPNAKETAKAKVSGEQKEREALVKEGKRVFTEPAISQLPITNDSVPAVEPETVDIRALQHGK